MFNHNFTKLTNFLAASFLGIIFFPSLVFNICLLLGIGETRWTLAVTVGLLVPIFFYKIFDAKIKSLVWLVGLISIATTISSYLYDLSYDGTSYHADAILLIMQGVNPIYQKMHGFDDLWTNHYPKAFWYFCAVIGHLTGNYSIGKIYNYLLIYTVFAYVFGFLKERGLNCRNSFFTAVATAISPVAVAQINSFYADGALCSLTSLVMFAGFASVFVRRKIDYIIFVMSACLLINLKFTGAVSVAIVVFAVSVISIWKKCAIKQANNRIWISIAAICLIGGIIMGFNPYISNYIEEGHPFFPLFGKHKVEILKEGGQNPYSYNSRNNSRVGQILASVFSETRNMYKGHTAEPILKIPFSVTKDQIDELAYTDTRIAGWGVLFSGLLLLSLALYIISKGWRDKQIALILITVIITILINPGSWWARYAPQLALLPILFVIASKQNFYRNLVIFLYIANSLIIAIPSSWLVIDETNKLNSQIDYILQKCGKGKYIVKGHEGWHYEQFLNPKGIEIVFPQQEINPPKNQLFPLYDIFLYKEGCYSLI